MISQRRADFRQPKDAGMSSETVLPLETINLTFQKKMEESGFLFWKKQLTQVEKQIKQSRSMSFAPTWKDHHRTCKWLQ